MRGWASKGGFGLPRVGGWARHALMALVLSAMPVVPAAHGAESPWDAPGQGNPLLPGYAADPSIVHWQGRWYVFTTLDPWGDDRLGLWQSDNGRDWTFSTPDWPTKAAATSPTSGDAKVWAPSVVQGRDGRWWMYVSVGSEVWVGTAPTPAGPWRDAKGGKPLIPANFIPGYHMIDAEAFIDDDGQAYLYWGSGLNWVNGHCFVVRLNPDMISFDGQPRDVTPGHYFEAPFMLKTGGRYFLMYSDGNTIAGTYQVRYAVGESPLGPFTEAPGNPLLATDADKQIISPGHHAVFRSGGQTYILYHRQGLPFPPADAAVLRQVVVDRLDVGADGLLRRVIPSHDAPVAGFAPRRTIGLTWRAVGGGDGLHGPARAGDDNYATLWKPAPGEAAVLTADLGAVRPIKESRLLPEYPTHVYHFRVEASDDGRTWKRVTPDQTGHGSPIIVSHPVRARYLRLVFTGEAALWEWSLF
ncbi:F5/8 type C domain-containing protein [Nitrospirillum pindoramense]|uniref:F5/8 type C domain-containing protein n=2 Tax=Nitrospirillum amazonense TaxID=28077 RepID=A0A560GRW8_9PROT|nr:F5/8 type C domain-containing protein [Nitrospirillum amazonense]